MARVSLCQGKGSQMHNRREYTKYEKEIPEHIDISRSNQNITLIDLDIREVYKEIFGEALNKYNQKQKRADRKIKDYYSHIEKSKNGEKLFYEDIVQWGSKIDFNNHEVRQKAKEALIKYVEGFEARNVNLKLIGAYIHMDEASPHLHIDYIPVASGYSRGLEVRNSLDRAMKQMGFYPENESRKNNATKLWKDNERLIFKEICYGLGLEVEQERKSRGTLSVEEYKEARDNMLNIINQEKEELINEVEPFRKLKAGINDIAEKGKKIPFRYVVLKQKDFNKIKEQAQTYIVNRDELERIRERSALLDAKEKEIIEREKKVIEREKEVEEMYQEQAHLNFILEDTREKYSSLYSKFMALKEHLKEIEFGFMEIIGCFKNMLLSSLNKFNDRRYEEHIEYRDYDMEL